MTTTERTWPAPWIVRDAFNEHDVDAATRLTWADALHQASCAMEFTWRPEDSSRAYMHDWDLFECDSDEHGPWEIQYDQDSDTFTCDEDAWFHVYKHASQELQPTMSDADMWYLITCRRALRTVRVFNRPHYDDIMNVVADIVVAAIRGAIEVQENKSPN